MHYQGLDAYVNSSVPVGSVMTAYCQEGKKRGANIQTVHKCGAALTLTGSYGECSGMGHPCILLSAVPALWVLIRLIFWIYRIEGDYYQY